MFERFTDNARRVIVCAQEISRDRKVESIPTEHLLMAVMEQSSTLWGLLDHSGADIQVVAQLKDQVPEGLHAPSGHIPFTPSATKALEHGLREALALDASGITTGHVLLGLMRNSENGAAKALATVDVSIEDAREMVAKEFPTPQREAATADAVDDALRDVEAALVRLRKVLGQ